MSDKQCITRNAVIVSAKIEAISGQAYFKLTLDYGNATQSTGYVGITAEALGQLLTVANVVSWSKIVGRAVRAKLVLLDPMGQTIVEIGHIIRDEWLLISDRLEKEEDS
jgi:hypothetical protein